MIIKNTLKNKNNLKFGNCNFFYEHSWPIQFSNRSLHAFSPETKHKTEPYLYNRSLILEYWKHKKVTNTMISLPETRSHQPHASSRWRVPSSSMSSPSSSSLARYFEGLDTCAAAVVDDTSRRETKAKDDIVSSSHTKLQLSLVLDTPPGHGSMMMVWSGATTTARDGKKKGNNKRVRFCNAGTTSTTDSTSNRADVEKSASSFGRFNKWMTTSGLLSSSSKQDTTIDVAVSSNDKETRPMQESKKLPEDTPAYQVVSPALHAFNDNDARGRMMPDDPVGTNFVEVGRSLVSSEHPQQEEQQAFLGSDRGGAATDVKKTTLPAFTGRPVRHRSNPSFRSKANCRWEPEVNYHHHDSAAINSTFSFGSKYQEQQQSDSYLKKKLSLLDKMNENCFAHNIGHRYTCSKIDEHRPLSTNNKNAIPSSSSPTRKLTLSRRNSMDSLPTYPTRKGFAPPTSPTGSSTTATSLSSSFNENQKQQNHHRKVALLMMPSTSFCY